MFCGTQSNVCSSEASPLPRWMGLAAYTHIVLHKAQPLHTWLSFRPSVETCRRLQIPIRDYLTAILPGIADLPVSRVAELTPTAWAARS